MITHSRTGGIFLHALNVYGLLYWRQKPAYNKVYFRRLQRNKRLQHPECDSEEQHQRVSFLTFDAVDRDTEYRMVNKSHSAFL